MQDDAYWPAERRARALARSRAADPGAALHVPYGHSYKLGTDHMTVENRWHGKLEGEWWKRPAFRITADTYPAAHARITDKLSRLHGQKWVDKFGIEEIPSIVEDTEARAAHTNDITYTIRKAKYNNWTPLGITVYVTVLEDGTGTVLNDEMGMVTFSSMGSETFEAIDAAYAANKAAYKAAYEAFRDHLSSVDTTMIFISNSRVIACSLFFCTSERNDIADATFRAMYETYANKGDKQKHVIQSDMLSSALLVIIRYFYTIGVHHQEWFAPNPSFTDMRLPIWCTGRECVRKKSVMLPDNVSCTRLYKDTYTYPFRLARSRYKDTFIHSRTNEYARSTTQSLSLNIQSDEPQRHQGGGGPQQDQENGELSIRANCELNIDKDGHRALMSDCSRKVTNKPDENVEIVPILKGIICDEETEYNQRFLHVFVYYRTYVFQDIGDEQTFKDFFKAIPFDLMLMLLASIAQQNTTDFVTTALRDGAADAYAEVQGNTKKATTLNSPLSPGIPR